MITRKWGWEFTTLKEGQTEATYNNFKVIIEDSVDFMTNDENKRILINHVVRQHATNLKALVIGTSEILICTIQHYNQLKAGLENEFWNGLKCLGVEEEGQKNQILIQLMSELNRILPK